MAIKELLEQNTDVVELATSLLATLDDITGQFVWKKMQPVEITMVQTAINPLTFVMSSEQVDLTTVDVSYFNGMSGTFSNGTWYIENGTLYLNNNARGTLTYTSANRTLASSDNITATFTWGCVSGKKAFVDFVVADDEDSYPNGGELDDYWYELVEEGAGGVEVFEITPATDTQQITVQHTLGVTPSQAMICANEFPNEQYSAIFACDGIPYTSTGSGGVIAYQMTGSQMVNATMGMSSFPSGNRPDKSASEVTFYPYSSLHYFRAGITYTIRLFA